MEKDTIFQNCQVQYEFKDGICSVYVAKGEMDNLKVQIPDATISLLGGKILCINDNQKGTSFIVSDNWKIDSNKLAFKFPKKPATIL